MLGGGLARPAERVAHALERALQRLPHDLGEMAELEEPPQSGAMRVPLAVEIVEQAGQRHQTQPRRLLLLGALALVMEDVALMRVEKLDARPEHAPAVLHVLVEEEVALVEPAEPHEDIPANQQTGADEE